ncbi:hypothetical protein [Sphingobacterium rhinopitheci]|uniref:hypothetical protein n=1 Tax=Sphingobacterium rhinopitheci TaxID=2781960 RepID=UPI001F525F4B|nr:hypothetical protein [Sphingobacterium rhinopitheci]MCI0921865.1 hypothetical protein [Sphingobacterium rhinopitheci]
MKNSLPLGVLIGLFFPLVAYLLTVYTEVQAAYFVEKPIAIYVMAAVINLGIFRFSYRAGKDVFAKGILMITFLAMLFLVFGTGLKV